MYNLVGNSCKFTERGSIWVDASVLEGGDMVAVRVGDTGIGIPGDKLDDIFAPFEQVGAQVLVFFYFRFLLWPWFSLRRP